MNRATRAAIISTQANPFDLRAALFHSTPVLDRKRRTHWDYKGSAYKGSSRSSSKQSHYYSRNFRKMNAKEELLRNVGAFAETLFQRMDHDEYEYEYGPSSSRGSSWFRYDHGDWGFRGGGTYRRGPRAGVRGGFQFCEDDFEVEPFFRSAFGTNGPFFWSFTNDEPPRSSSGYYGNSYYNNNSRTSWNWRNRNEEDYDYSTDSDNSKSNLTRERTTLGLSASGSINMDDVKNAYRKCALKWHPDRHQGSSKAVAEEKFKVCSAAYQSLCDKMAID